MDAAVCSASLLLAGEKGDPATWAGSCRRWPIAAQGGHGLHFREAGCTGTGEEARAGATARRQLDRLDGWSSGRTGTLAISQHKTT